jgi:hypothetical protein
MSRLPANIGLPARSTCSNSCDRPLLRASIASPSLFNEASKRPAHEGVESSKLPPVKGETRMPQRSHSSRGRNSSRSSNEPMMSQWAESARDHPLTTAAAAAGAAAAGVFLWSRRNQISDQISRLGNQISDWTENMQSGNSGRELAMTGGPNESSAIESSRATAARTRPSTGNGRTARSRRTAGRAQPQSATM